MLSKGVALAVILGTLRLSTASADAPIHLTTPSDVQTQGGTKLTLPPGYFVDEPTWLQLDNEIKRLQDQETRLEAENKSLRKSLDAGGITITIIMTSFVLGAGIGYALK